MYVCVYIIYIFYIIILMHRGGGWLLVGQGVLILPNVSLYQPKTNQPFREAFIYVLAELVR